MNKDTEIPLPLTMVRLIRLAPGPLCMAIAMAMVSAALSIIPMVLIYRIIVALSAAVPDRVFVWQQVLLITAALVMRWVLMAMSHVQAHTGAFRIQYLLKIALARRLGEVPLSFFSRRGSGSLRRTLNDDVNSLEGFFAHMLPDAVASATVPLAALILLVICDWRLGLATLAPLPLALLAQWWFMRGSGQRMREWSDLQKRIANRVGEYVRGIHIVKTFGLSARSFGELAESVRGTVEWVTRFSRATVSGWVIFTALLTASLVVVAPLGAWLVINGRADLATLVLFLLVAPSVLAPLLRLTFTFGEQLQRQQAMARIGEILASTPLEDSPNAVPEGDMNIEFRHVQQRYDQKWVLQDVSIKASSGQLTAIVGASGSGKSTLLRLVARLYEYEEGELLVAGRDVREWPLDALLNRISIVFQDVFLFHGSVRDNLRMASPNASDHDIENAAKAARAHHFITALPQGYDTVVGDGGERLSGGERQRLSIARALLKDAPILLLDEATASVDAENEVYIQQALNELCKQRTVLMVAHRLQTVMHADQIVVMSQGQVAGCGVHDELLQHCSVYKALWYAHQNARLWRLSQNKDDEKLLLKQTDRLGEETEYDS